MKVHQERVQIFKIKLKFPVTEYLILQYVGLGRAGT